MAVIEREGKRVELRPYQIEHVKTLKQILSEHTCAIDLSPTGSGKTYTTIALLIHYNPKHVLVICPKTVKASWLQAEKTTGFNISDIITYNTLAGTRGRGLKHSYLTRYEDLERGTTFLPTEELKKKVEEGLFVIIDEAQKTKNDTSLCTKACRAIVTMFLMLHLPYSKVMLLSGSIIDKESQALTILRTMGFIQHRNLYDNNANVGFRLRGADELLEHCMKLDPITTMKFPRPQVKQEVLPFCFNLFCNVIERHLVSAMPSPDVTRAIFNAYYPVEEGNQTLIQEGISMLQRATRYSDEREDYDSKEAEWGAITRSLMLIEKAKLPIFIRCARTKLEQDPFCQVIIFVNYKDTINQLKFNLVSFSPQCLEGSTPEKKRFQIIDSFQEGKCRLLIANTEVGGAGISLHDTLGGRIRYVFGSPNYKALSMHQATGRVFREGVKSQAVVHWVYVKGQSKETKILDALSRKGETMSRVMESQTQEGIKFPGQYESVEVEY